MTEHTGYPRSATEACTRGVDLASWPTATVGLVEVILSNCFNSDHFKDMGSHHKHGMCCEIYEVFREEIQRRRSAFIDCVFADVDLGK